MSQLAVVAAGIAATGCASQTGQGASKSAQSLRGRRFFFTSQGKTAMMRDDGADLKYFDFHVPNQATWQPGPFLSNGHQVVLLSMEPRRDGPGKPFEEYYTQTPTHLWIYDLQSEQYTEIANRERLAVFYTPSLLVSDSRILVQVVRNKVGQIFSMNLDGTDAREFTRAGEGLPYGLSLSPDKSRVAFHLASPQGYQIWTSDLEGKNRIQVAAHPDHLYFGTSWSPDGKWILYQDCLFKQDPGHDWSDLCIARPDGSERRSLTEGQSHWFATAYGTPQNRGGGSNMAAWTKDGAILYSRRLPNTRVPWVCQQNRPDTDHFNRDYLPDGASGGSQICRIDPSSLRVTALTPAVDRVWDFRMSESPDGKSIVFCRARVGESPSIWTMHSDGTHPMALTAGWQGMGADHPRWLPIPSR